MAKDFDLDVQVLKTEAANDDNTRIFSKSLCTPGCNQQQQHSAQVASLHVYRK